eukprot:TRINITY_DN19505_c0_g1_i3.p2 TRINITY_DN19505_c0_g1~~TRINITY_DN19505_c0_g1_i3.p2  ORF type:complete len:175 (+),score=4.88 TRINITY_DN19505_c0_g1_i3:151-675(+)
MNSSRRAVATATRLESCNDNEGNVGTGGVLVSIPGGMLKVVTLAGVVDEAAKFASSSSTRSRVTHCLPLRRKRPKRCNRLLLLGSPDNVLVLTNEAVSTSLGNKPVGPPRSTAGRATRTTNPTKIGVLHQATSSGYTMQYPDLSGSSRLVADSGMLTCDGIMSCSETPTEREDS